MLLEQASIIITGGLLTQPGTPEDSWSQQSVNLVSEVLASPGCIPQWNAERYIQPLTLGSTMPLATLLHFSPFKMRCPVSYWD